MNKSGGRIQTIFKDVMTAGTPNTAIRRGRGGARPGAGRKRSMSPVTGGITARDEVTSGGCFVYVVHETDCPGVCKIGIAKDPMTRFSSLQVGTWRQLTLACAFGVPSQTRALAIEAAVHQALCDLHLRGEWFKVSASKACSMILSAANRECGDISMGLDVDAGE